MTTLKDIQNETDHRRLSIDKVGVKGIRYPIIVRDRAHSLQHTVATINMYVSLPHHFKGTHMSRFIEVLNAYRDGISTPKIAELLASIKDKLDSRAAHVEIEFPFFIEKKAPVTQAKSLMGYMVKINGTLIDTPDLMVGVAVPVTTLCPCSREISNYGAHNQRSIVTVDVRFHKFFWIEDLIQLIEQSASSEIFPLLKRPDEKLVTETAFENPMFVEDVVRNVALQLEQDPNFTWYAVSSENHESIHNHSAYACIEKRLSDGPGKYLP